MTTLLITGFGRFPGAASNPTAAIVRDLIRRRRPALAAHRLVGHVFETRWDAVDRDLPMLLARETPEVVVLLGVATRADRVRIEMVARNRRTILVPDAGGVRSDEIRIAPGAPFFRPGRFPVAHLAAALRQGGLAPLSSRHAGGYLCNYAYWRALEAAQMSGGPRLVVFVHVPPLHRLRDRNRSASRRRLGRGPIAAQDRLVAALQHLLVAAVAAR
ncbi:pyroglutamyl-peptidase I [Rhodoplanes azumiensis]|uniref:Pyrrolidone-carboxylate peptidase n=1 Tax=Rhodoplanes azumiensis TaxID=1897628 RepID=A0ABW5AGL7_9BRAD